MDYSLLSTIVFIICITFLIIRITCKCDSCKPEDKNTIRELQTRISRLEGTIYGKDYYHATSMNKEK